MTEKAESETADEFAGVIGLAMTIPPLWALALLAVQCITWLKTGIWQEVPAVAVFLSPEAQRFNLRMTEVGFSPLDLVPSWASYSSAEAVIAALSGRMVGVSKIIGWLLEASLGGWLVSLSIGTCCALIAYVHSKR